MADGKYRVEFTKDQWVEIPRWSFFQREQGYGIFSELYTAFNAKEERRGRVLQFQLLAMTLGHQESYQTEAFIAQQAELLKGKEPNEAQQEIYKKLIEGIYENEHKDYLKSRGIDPETKLPEPEEKKTKNPKGTSDPAT